MDILDISRITQSVKRILLCKAHSSGSYVGHVYAGHKANLIERTGELRSERLLNTHKGPDLLGCQIMSYFRLHRIGLIMCD